MSIPLQVHGLEHHYGNEKVFEQLSFEVHSGELLTLIGESGCGKTTLIRDIAGLSTPSAGKIFIGGQEVFGTNNVPPEKRGVGLVFQDYALFPTLTVAENIGLALRGTNPERITALIELTGLVGLEERLPAQLSGGQQQRVALARALAPRPQLLLLDEPFANLDAMRKFSIADDLIHILRAENTCAVLITHDQQDALGFSDRIAVLGNSSGCSTLLQLGSAEDVYARPAAQEVAELLGSSNILNGIWDGQVAHSILGPLQLENPELLREKTKGASLSLSIRPEQIRAANGEQFTLKSCHYLGSRYRLSCSLPEQPEQELIIYADRPFSTSTLSLSVNQPVWALPASL